MNTYFRKAILVGALFLSSPFAQANSELLQYVDAIKAVVVESTTKRIDAARKENLEQVCYRTSAYYIAFEQFNPGASKTIQKMLSDKIGPFVYRNFAMIQEQGLPRQLHFACMENNKKKIVDVMNKIFGIYILE